MLLNFNLALSSALERISLEAFKCFRRMLKQMADRDEDKSKSSKGLGHAPVFQALELIYGIENIERKVGFHQHNRSTSST